jgi:hypothetical protein
MSSHDSDNTDIPQAQVGQQESFVGLLGDLYTDPSVSNNIKPDECN